jgi:predicted ATP-grasp superfamily ATP-dependent carboligase
MRGSCFPSDRYDTAAIRDYAFRILDAISFDFGAARIELIVAEDGPYLVEVNP